MAVLQIVCNDLLGDGCSFDPEFKKKEAEKGLQTELVEEQHSK